MSPEEMRDYIRGRSEDKKLVLFVGAGVSVNSGLPLWSKLVEDMDISLGSKRSDSHASYSNDELLRIPQLLYDSNKDNYEEILTRTFDRDLPKSNAIIDELLKLKPYHIITTNYDQLIEKSLDEFFSTSTELTNEDSVQQYFLEPESIQSGGVLPSSVPLASEATKSEHTTDQEIENGNLPDTIDDYALITCDNDFLSTKKNQFYIKMHGCIKNKEHIVLKEDDYLCYEKDHFLTDLHIKTLFLSYTFIFVGYGINDYNLKLIMNWAQQQYRLNNCNKIPVKHFFLSSENHNERDVEYFKKKNVEILTYDSISVEFSLEKSSEFKDSRGNHLLDICRHLTKSDTTTKKGVYRKLTELNEGDFLCFRDVRRAFDLRSGVTYKIRDALYLAPLLHLNSNQFINVLLDYANGEIRDSEQMRLITSVLMKSNISSIGIPFPTSERKILPQVQLHEDSIAYQRVLVRDLLFASNYAQLRRELKQNTFTDELTSAFVKSALSDTDSLEEYKIIHQKASLENDLLKRLVLEINLLNFRLC